LAAFRCAFAYFFMALRCFLDAFLNILCCFLADFLDASRDSRAYFATPGLWALPGTDDAPLKPTSSMNKTIRFTRVFLPDFLTSTSLHWLRRIAATG
jgi:hypothetical protein